MVFHVSQCQSRFFHYIKVISSEIVEKNESTLKNHIPLASKLTNSNLPELEFGNWWLKWLCSVKAHFRLVRHQGPLIECRDKALSLIILVPSPYMVRKLKVIAFFHQTSKFRNFDHRVIVYTAKTRA